MSDNFNPLALAKRVIADTNLTDPSDIAQEVLERTPDHEIREVYLTTLRHVAREAIRLSNMTASTPPQAPKPSAPNKSSKIAAIRSAHISYYDQRVFASGTWKMLGDCTVTDVLDLVEQRRAIAEANYTKSAEYKLLADQMIAAGVNTARELEGIAA